MQRNASGSGCWTCKIRHRKCDGARPACKECVAKHLDCHGYGGKPLWMADPTALHRELARIKRIVKDTTRKSKKSSATHTNATGDHIKAIPADALRQSRSDGHFSMRESELMIYYLDYVFAIQFPYYADRIESGGRGWLFWLLMKNVPLQQAAFTLSALHQYKTSVNKDVKLEQELLGYHIRALRGLHDSLHSLQADLNLADKERLVEFLACTLCLISFEVFHGESNNWQTHLEVINGVISRLTPPGSESSSHDTGSLHKSATLLDNAEKFCIANAIWFDILSCASTASDPKSHYKIWVGEQHIDISQIMGCSNWVMEAIGDIASIMHPQLSGHVKAKKSRIHESALVDGIAQLRSNMKPTTPLTNRISLVFATAALVHLYVSQPDIIKSAPQIEEAVEMTIDALRSIPPDISRRGLVWPICVTGSMATTHQQTFFEEMLTKILQDADSGFGNCEVVLRILRHCWTSRSSSVSLRYSWQNAMADLGVCTLLV